MPATGPWSGVVRNREREVWPGARGDRSPVSGADSEAPGTWRVKQTKIFFTGKTVNKIKAKNMRKCKASFTPER